MNQQRLMKIIVAPVMSEKSTRVGEKNRQVVFKVVPDAEKAEIKKAVELLFKVEVKSVRTLNMEGKRKRFGQMFGNRKSWKKAYVALKEGHDIDFVNAESK